MTVTDTWRALAADWAVDSGTLRNALEDAADAVDEARAELELYVPHCCSSCARELPDMQARAEAAEARVAIALRVHHNRYHDRGAYDVVLSEFHAALTEGTGQ